MQEIEVRMPNGQVKIYPAGTPTSQIQADVDLMLKMQPVPSHGDNTQDFKRLTPASEQVGPPPAPPQRQGTAVSTPSLFSRPGAPTQMTAGTRDPNFDPVKDIGNAALDATSLGVGVSPMALPARVGLQTLLGYLRGGDEGALFQGGAEAGAGILGPAIARTGQAAALGAGGAYSRLGWKDAREAVNATMRTSALQRSGLRAPGGPYFNPATGAKVDEILPGGFWKRAIPLGSGERLANLNRTLDRGLMNLEDASPGAVNDLAFGDPAIDAGLYKRAESSLEPETEAKKLLDKNQAFYQQNRNRGRRTFNVRELGDFKREQNLRGSAVIENRAAGTRMAGDDAPGDQLFAAYGQKAKDLQETLAPQVRPVNSAISDTYKMSKANKAMANSASFELGKLGVRGGLGFGLGNAYSSAADVAGIPDDRRVDSALGGLLGMFFLNPRILSSSAFTLARLLESGPTVQRALALDEDVNKAMGVKKRKPSGSGGGK